MTMEAGEKAKRVKACLYDGTIESYNALANHLWDGVCMHIWFLDKDCSMTPAFTGIVTNVRTGIIYKPGDTYFMEIEDDNH